MRNLTSTIVALALLAHAAADATGRDGHHCAECEARQLQQLLGTVNSEPLAAEGERSASDHPCHCEVHGGGTCNYLPSQKSLRDDLPRQIGAFAVEFSGLSSPNANSSYPWLNLHGRAFESPPMRLHLRHQLLLI